MPVLVACTKSLTGCDPTKRAIRRDGSCILLKRQYDASRRLSSPPGIAERARPAVISNTSVPGSGTILKLDVVHIGCVRSTASTPYATIDVGVEDVHATPRVSSIILVQQVAKLAKAVVGAVFCSGVRFRAKRTAVADNMD